MDIATTRPKRPKGQFGEKLREHIADRDKFRVDGDTMNILESKPKKPMMVEIESPKEKGRA